MLQRRRSLGREDMTAGGVSQGFQQCRGLADPIGECLSDQIEPLAVEDLALAMQKKMVAMLARQHMGQQATAGAATLDRARRQRACMNCSQRAQVGWGQQSGSR